MYSAIVQIRIATDWNKFLGLSFNNDMTKIKIKRLKSFISLNWQHKNYIHMISSLKYLLY